MNSKKRLLIFIEWFIPGYKAGGPIQSCVNLCIALKNRYDIYVFTTDTDHGETTPYRQVIANSWINEPNTGVQVYYAKKTTLQTGVLRRIIREIKADILYLNLLFSPHFVLYPLWLKFTGRLKAAIVLCPRGTLYDSAISLKLYKKRPLLLIIRRMGIHRQITFHATNKREEKAIHHYFPGSKTVIADNLPNTRQLPFVSCPKAAGSLLCVFIARLVAIKNLHYLLRLLKNVHYQVTLTIAGPSEDIDYWSACQKAIGELPHNIKVNYIGPKQHALLSGLIQQHHLFVLPTSGENFGHAIFESLLAGRPALISDQTPWLNLEEHNAGWAVPLNDPEKFIDLINQMAKAGQDQFDSYAMSAWQYARRFIQQAALAEQYQKLFAFATQK